MSSSESELAVQNAVLEERNRQLQERMAEQARLLREQTELVLQAGAQQNMLILDLISRTVRVERSSNLSNVLVGVAPLLAEMLKMASTHTEAPAPQGPVASPVEEGEEEEEDEASLSEHLSAFVDGYCAAKGRPDLGDDMFGLMPNTLDASDLASVAEEAYRKALHASQEPDPEKETELGKLCQEYAEFRGRKDLASALHDSVFARLPFSVVSGPQNQYHQFVSPELLQVAWEETLSEDPKDPA